MPIILAAQHIAELKNCTDNGKITELLLSFSAYRLRFPPVIKNYHDLLLFYCAFPFSNKILMLANAELKRIAEAAGTKKGNSLLASGIAHTGLLCSFSLAIAGWLVHKFPDDVELAGSDASKETVANIFQALSPAVEFEKSSQGGLHLISRIKWVTGLNKNTDQLKWLVQLFEESQLPELVKEELYAELKVFLRWKLDNVLFSKSFLRIPFQKLYYHKKKISQVDSHKIIKQKTGKPVLLSATGKTALLDCMKASLAFQYRETDPVTYGDTGELELFDMGRGLQIALTGMKKEKRLALESYVGYMAFKNGVPVSYGGGWLWGHQCKVGINIYPSFRRGESAWLFCQVLRVYYQYLGARQFIVKPYQYGKGNPEGLRSGAFWFYYKLGFRPVDEEIKNKAETEWKKICSIKNYRTSLKVLQYFTKSKIVWISGKKWSPGFDAANVSSAVSNMINLNFNHNRDRAITACLKKLSREFSISSLKNKTVYQRQVMENWSLLAGLSDDLAEWNALQKKNFVQLIKLKQTGKERDYILQLQKHQRLWKSLQMAIMKQANKMTIAKQN